MTLAAVVFFFFFLSTVKITANLVEFIQAAELFGAILTGMLVANRDEFTAIKLV